MKLQFAKPVFLSALCLLGLAQLPVLAADHQAEELFQAGQVLASKKEYDKAMSAYLQAITHDPKHEKARLALAILYGKQKEFAKALKEVEAVQKINPKSYVSYKVQGLLLKDQNKPAEAANAFETYLKLAPTDKVKDSEEIYQLIQKLRAQSKQPAAGG